MRSIRRIAERRSPLRTFRHLAVLALCVCGPLAGTQAHAGGLLVSDGNGIYRYNALTGVFSNSFTPPQGSGMGAPLGMTLASSDTILYSASGTNGVLASNLQTGAALGTLVASGSGGLQNPHGMVIGPDGYLYVASTATNRVLRYDAQTGALIGTFVASGSGGLTAPWGLAFGPDGNLYVSSSANHRIVRYNGQTGAFSSLFVPAGTGGLSTPKGLAFGWDGNLYVCSGDNDRILRYNGQTGAFIDSFVAAGSGGLQNPTDLAFTLDHYLYVCSAGTGSVLRYDDAGAFVNVLVAAGSGGLGQPQALLLCPPDAPTGLTATVVSSSQINLSWSQPFAEATLQYVYRKAGTGSWGLRGLLAGNTTIFSDNSLSPNTSYSYAIRAAGPGGVSALSNEAQGTTLPLPPAAPSSLTGSALSDTQIRLTWTDNSSNETSFTIWRKSGAADWAVAGTVAANTTSFTDTGLTEATAYTYRLRAGNTGGNSDWTGEVSVTTRIAPPPAPTALTGSVLSATQVKLTWTDNSTNETAFAIWRKSAAADWTRVGVVIPDTTQYVDIGLTTGVAYTYRVRAVNNGGASDWTSEVTQTPVNVPPPPTAPAAPTGLTANTAIHGQISLSWQDHSNNETAFAIWRKSNTQDWVRIAVVIPNTTTYTDRGLPGNTAYSYRVRATNNTGASDWTNVMNVTSAP